MQHLRIQNLTLKNFRNYQAASLSGFGPVNIITGPNAVGKTNLIEGIQLLCALSSFRHATLEQLIRRDCPQGSLAMHVSNDLRELDISLTLTDKSRKYSLNSKPKRPVDLKGLIPAVVFTPDDLTLVKGSTTQRRSALDALGTQVNKNYYVVRRDYEKVIRHKNRLLKDEADQSLVDAINEMVITCGAQLSVYRAALFARLAPYVEQGYAQISGGRERLSVMYRPAWCSLSPSFFDQETGLCSFSRDDARQALAAELVNQEAAERERRRSLVGPHTDELAFYLDGAPAQNFASQGQQRSIVLAWKLAEAQVIEDILDQAPVLLLDDVMSELDETRRRALVEHMAQGCQAFITTAHLDYFDSDLVNAANVIRLPDSPK